MARGGALSRIAHIVQAARAARSWELTKLGDRDAVRIVGADGTRMSVLSPAELAEFRAAIDAAPDVWTIAGLPPCTFDGTSEMAHGRDEANAVSITLIGTRAQLTPAFETHAARSYAAVLGRRDELALEIARRLGPLYNKTWRDRGPTLSVAQVAARVKLDSVTFSLDELGPPTLYFDDGDLFAGHQIAVELAADGSVADCSI